MGWSFELTFARKLIAGGFAASFLAIPFAIRYAQDQRAPDYQTMRQYRISKLSDDQIRSAYEAAQSAFAQSEAHDEEQRRKDNEESTKRMAKCASDRAYAERVGWSGCSFGLNTGEPITPSREQSYDMIIMGRCMFVNSVRDAKKAGCLPDN
jgi:hypothetical protein